jgi:DhnA family fructose-bisphosphate aldolase class Ia
VKPARLNRLFNPKTRRRFDFALDHGIFNEAGFHAGIENLPKAIEIWAADLERQRTRSVVSV